MNISIPPSYVICHEDEETLQIIRKIDQYLLFISVPINFLGILCILRASKSHLAPMRWAYLNHQLWLLFFDIVQSGLILPKYLLPAPAATPYGLFRILPVPHSLIALIFSVGWTGMISSLVQMLFQRHQSIVPATHPRRFSPLVKTLALFFIYVQYFPLDYWLVATVAGDVDSLKAIAKELPCVPADLLLPETVILSSENNTIFLVMSTITFFTVVSSGSWFIFESFYYLHKEKEHVSRQTRSTLMRALVILIIQAVVPVILMAIPVMILDYIWVNKVKNEGLLASIVCAVSLHASFATIVMLTLNRSYRKYLKSFVTNKNTASSTFVISNNK